MGGGGAMRAAAKIAGIGAVNGGIRGLQAVSSSEHSFTAAARNSKRSVEPLTASAASVDKVTDDSVEQKPISEIDDWEFAGGEEDMFQVSGQSTPGRLVFGGVPTLREAQVATSELKDALEKTYLSPMSSGGTSSIISDQESGSRKHSNSENLETRTCVAFSDNTLTPLLPKHASRALVFFNQSPDVQNVVASIASDPNVWGAVMQNPELVGFLKSYNTGGSFLEKEESESDGEVSGSGNWLSDSMKNIGMVVADMMSNLSEYFKKLFGGEVEGEGSEGGSEKEASVADMVMGGSFLGLAVMVMMIVVLQRG